MKKREQGKKSRGKRQDPKGLRNTSGAKRKKAKSTRKKVNNQSGPRSSFSTRIILYLLLFALVVNGAFVYNLFFRKIDNIAVSEVEETKKVSKEKKELLKIKEEQEKEEQKRKSDGKVDYYNPASDGNLNNVVTGEDDILSVLNNLKTGLGIDFEGEYRVSSVAEFQNEKRYYLQQYYQDIEVASGALMVSVSSSGMVKSVTGTHLDLNDIDTEPSFGDSEARDCALKYVVKQYQFNPENVSLDSSGYKIFQLDSDDIKAGYQIGVSYCDTNYTTLFVDGKTGDVLVDQAELKLDRVVKNLNGQNSTRQLYVDQLSDTEFQLKDDETKLEIYNAGNISHKDALTAKGNGNMDIVSWDESSENGDSQVDQDSVDALASLETVYSFYKDIFGRNGLTDDEYARNIPVYTHITTVKDNGQDVPFNDNAGMAGYDHMIIGNGSDLLSASFYVDVMGHEFTHGVISYQRSLNNTGPLETDEFGAINEGLADLFGEFVDDYTDDSTVNGSAACDWKSPYRDCKTPVEGQVTDARQFTSDTDCHQGCYIITHPAYLMSQGIDGDNTRKLGNEQIALLYYDYIRGSMTSLETFRSMRTEIENLMYTPLNAAGKAYTITDLQRECILDAFDSVGIERNTNYSITPTGTIYVYGVNGDLYKNATIRICSYDGSEVVPITKVPKGKCKLNNLTPGKYIVYLDDISTHRVKPFTLTVNDNDDKPLVPYDKRLNIFTTFDAVEGNVALVLDVSGSMAGTPIEQVRAASTLFFESIASQAPYVNVELITYDSEARTISEAGNDLTVLKNAINNLGAGGGTNIQDALQKARDTLTGKTNTAIVIMSDGLPNEGDAGPDGDYIKPVVNLAKSIKKDGTFIYSFGFFHNTSGSELQTGQNLMEKIATENYSYIVTDAESDTVAGTFDLIAFQIQNPGQTIHEEIQCPVDVMVKYNGQTLSSAEKNRVTRTDFGILTFSGENNEKKILNLKRGPDYEVVITGYDKGTMNYSVSYADEKGKYIDERSFKDVPVTNKTIMSSNSGYDEKTVLRVDTNGDGNYDKIYSAKVNSEAKEDKLAGLARRVIPLVISGLLLLLIILFEIRNALLTIKLKKQPAVCPACGMEIKEGIKFCGRCGTKLVSGKTPAKKNPAKRKRAWIAKSIVAAVILLELFTLYEVNKSKVMSAYNNIVSNQYSMAAVIYDRDIKGRKVSEYSFSKLCQLYLSRVDHAYKAKKITSETARTIHAGIADLIGSAR